jgi:preprotein translocase subunit YajC
MGIVIVIVIVGFVAWLFLAVPWRRRQRAHVGMQDSVEVGDEIITAGGIHAIVRESGERELRVEIAPDVVVTLDRRAVAAVAVPVDEDGEASQEEAKNSAVEDDQDRVHDEGTR